MQPRDNPALAPPRPEIWGPNPGPSPANLAGSGCPRSAFQVDRADGRPSLMLQVDLAASAGAGAICPIGDRSGIAQGLFTRADAAGPIGRAAIEINLDNVRRFGMPDPDGSPAVDAVAACGRSPRHPASIPARIRWGYAQSMQGRSPARPRRRVA